jgi:hypothetical protein
MIRITAALVLMLAIFTGAANNALAAGPPDDTSASFVRSTPSTNAPTPAESSLSGGSFLSQLATLAGFPFNCPLHIDAPPPASPSSN